MNPSPAIRPTLLLVDDTASNIQLLVGLLKDDYHLLVATRGEQALQICAKAKHLDLVLLDVMMPEMDGYEVCRALRADPATRDLPIVFLTTKNEVADIVHGFALGANDYLSKPVHPSELRARVRTLTTLRAQQLELAEKNRELRESLHIVCHDVANHFGVVSLTLELMALRREKGLDHWLPRLAAASRNGIALTNLVRELRRTEEKGTQLGPVPLLESLREALLLVDAKLTDKKLTVSVDVPEATVMAEACALTNSVFGNILSNAAKFSHPGSAIEVRGRVEAGMVCVSIRDHGVGMPLEVIETLFDVSKSHSRLGTAGEKGTGFGMPLMRKFVVLFGGRVEVETSEAEADPAGHGTTFHVWLKVV